MNNTNSETLKTHFSSNEWPKFVAMEEGENSYVFTIDIEQHIRWFEGHFPEQPVLAGVVQTHWAGELARRFFSIEQDFQRMDNLKFQSVILPDIRVQLSLNYDAEKNAVKFRFYDSEMTYSEGKLVFAAN